MIQLRLRDGNDLNLNAYKVSDEEDGTILYHLMDEENKNWMKISLNTFELKVVWQDEEISDTQEVLQIKLDKLHLDLIELTQSGTDGSEKDNPVLTDPYDPESIKVQTKPFNLTLIASMIDDGYIDLAPDFQRNFVWDNFQKSRLIESILLRIPLPMFYFAEDIEGNISVVDGLQRLTTIKEFMDNKFNLKGLEYLGATCHGCYYSDASKGKILSEKYLKWFKMTQLTVNVIDPSSPAKVKYDIFRRLNTGGKPLNNQEIRNCLASKTLRDVLKRMTQLPEFKIATDNSIKPTRMEDMEVALRFICFHQLYQKDKTLSNYNGNMEVTLDNHTEELSKMKGESLEEYIKLYAVAMENAAYLFGGKYAFRKILPKHLGPEHGKKLINKALLTSWAVILSAYSPEEIRERFPKSGMLALPLAEEIKLNNDLYNLLSYGTNGRVNLQYAFKFAEMLFERPISVEESLF